MPRKGKRSQGQTKRWRALADPKVVECVSKLLVDPCSSSLGKTVGQHQQPEAPPPRGTGWRYRVNKWPLSVSGRSHKLVIPAEFPGKEFILLVGDSHLRSFADGVVPMPKGNLSFGFMATPGACADQLCAEMKHVALSRDPDLVVVLAPSNNLTVSRTIQEAGAAFRRYLETVCDRWTNVVVADFIPRLTVAKGYQDMMRHEFQRVAADFRLTYWHWADHFPLNSVDLWSHDGVHLGDDKGMPRLADVIWNSTYEHLETLAHKMPRMASPPPSTRVSPRIVVKRNAQVPRRPTTEWTCVGSSMKATPGVSTRTRIQKQKQEMQNNGSTAHDRPDPLQRRVWSVTATHYQGDYRYPIFSRNHQCTCNALTFLAYHNEGMRFNTPRLDKVLEEGDLLYSSTKLKLQAEYRFQNNCLSIEEVPNHIQTDKNVYNVHKSNIRCGYLSTDRNPWCFPLAKCLECLSKDVSHALLMVSPECFAVFRDVTGQYGLFDSHSRDAYGMRFPDGTAVMLTFNSLTSLISHLNKLFKGHGRDAAYEFVPVSFEPINTSSKRPRQQICMRMDATSAQQSEVGQEFTSTSAEGSKMSNPGRALTQETTKGPKDFSKLNKERRRKAFRRQTMCQNQQASSTNVNMIHKRKRGKINEIKKEMPAIPN